VRHLIDRGTLDSDGVFHSAKEAWRSVAMLQAEIEAFVREHGTEELLRVLGVVERPPERMITWSEPNEPIEPFIMERANPRPPARWSSTLKKYIATE